MTSHSVLIELFKKRIPKLVSNLHKGQSGRIGVIGGSKEFVNYKINFSSFTGK